MSKYTNTIGLNISSNLLDRDIFARVAFEEIEKNGQRMVKAHVESARNLDKINKLGTRTLTIEQYNNVADHDDVEFARNALALFDCYIAGTDEALENVDYDDDDDEYAN